MKTHFRAVYGTLKEGKGNYHAFHMDDPRICRKVWEGWLEGFEMYASGIPFVIRGKGRIFVQVFEFFDLSAMDEIDAMEIGAGYMLEDVEVPDLQPHNVSLYLYNGNITRYRKIVNGCY